MKKSFKLFVLTGALIAGSGSLAEGAVAVPPPDMPDAGSLAGAQRDKEFSQQSQKDKGKAEIAMPESKRPPLHMPAEVKIQVNGFKLSGQDIYRDSTLQALLTPYKGKMVTFQELQEGADKITAYFRKHGYLLARCYIPVQKISGGIVEYVVQIGRLDEVTVDNRTKIHDQSVHREIRFLKPGEHLTRKKLERAVWLLSDLAGADAKATLLPGRKTGTTSVKIELSNYKGKCGLITADNYGNRYTGYNEYGLAYDFLNPAHEGDQLDFNGNVTGAKLYNYGLQYRLPMGRDGLRLILGYNMLSYNLGDVYEHINAYGISRRGTMGWEYALRRSQFHNLYTGIYYEQNALTDEMRAFDSCVRKHSKGAVLSLFGDDMDGRSAFSWRADYKWGTLGFDNAEGRRQGQRSQTAGTFHKLNLNLLERQYLAHRLELWLSARGQLASSNLDSSEHFSLGGASGVRAYPTSEASGDMGYLVRAELRYSLTPPGRKDKWQLAGSFDHGGVQINKQKQGLGENHRYLQGCGLGLLYTRRNECFLRADYGWAIGAEQPKSDNSHARGRFWLRGGIYF
ncbi:ShlB/FhaC/HecB family hemolysin secretion/activation protein [Selenomonas ruminantium]|uniref:ShlB/FhaC/HecB family hemolysin secretion/activation protein n=1 Tax=Selenomonas ruminantium TaxID=971 RepID=UPI000945B555|nr:ShlB/FhaC/HecB family hemolysin secretion/activation protein [Selenomonas ruminantium]